MVILTDITEGKGTEESLPKGELLHKAILQTAIDGFWRTDLQGRLQEVNDTYCRMSGYTKSELLSMNISDLEAIITPEETAIHTRKILQEGENRFETFHRRKDGSIFPVEISAQYKSTEEGSIVAFLRDITDRKQAEAALQKSERLYRSLFENMLNGFAYCRMLFEDGIPQDFIYLSVNQAFENLTGIKNAVGRKVTEVIPGIKEADPRLFEIYGRVALTGLPESFEMFVEALQMWFSVSVYSPEKEYFVAVFDVITERKRTEEEKEIISRVLHLINTCSNREDLLRTVLSYLQEWSGCEAVGIRLREGEDYPYFQTSGFPSQFVLKETRLCSRNQEGEILRDAGGYPFLDCMCGNIIQGRFDPGKTFFTNGGSFWSSCTTDLLATTTEVDRQARTRNYCNAVGYESVALIPLRTKGVTFGLLQFNDKRTGRFTAERIALFERIAENMAIHLAKTQDEEEIRRLNNDLEQRVSERTTQLEAANKELEGFSYSVSHDLRAPLRHLTGFVNLLAEKNKDTIDDKGRHYLKVIEDSAMKMGQLLDDILSFSRMGRLEMKQSRVNMSLLLKEVLKMVQPEVKNREVIWSLGSLPEVQGDPSMLKMVWENLVLNAVKFTRRKPQAKIVIDYLSEQPYEEVFFIKDNGDGFDMEYKHKLFNLFQRLHREDDFEGTGLGLANVKRIINRHGGRVWAEGTVGEGATFYFSLPKIKI